MSTQQTASYGYSSRSSVTPTFPSKVILLLALLLPMLWGMVDISYHGHFHCDTLIKQVHDALRSKTHLGMYLDDQKDFAGNLEAGTVKCTCEGWSRKVVLQGKVVNEEIRQEFSDIAADAIGADRIDNQIETLNEGALKELQALLAVGPNPATLNYQVKDRGTIYLTGDLPSPEMGERITALVAKIRGVRSVVNDLGKHLEAQRVLVMRNIYFDFNKWQIRPESKPALDEASQYITDYLGKNAGGAVRIEGHTDSIATDKYNQWLSEKRAQAVLEALVSLGIPRDRLKAVGMGESKSVISPDDTPEKRQENRRIEFHFE